MWKWNKRKFLCWLTKQDWLQMLTYELVLLIRKMSPKRSLLWLIVRPKKKMCVYNCMVFKIRVGRCCFFFLVFFKPTSMLLPLKSHKLVCFFLTTAYQLFDMQYNVFGSKHRSNVQGNEENCWSRKQTRKRRWISEFSRSIFFCWHNTHIYFCLALGAC